MIKDLISRNISLLMEHFEIHSGNQLAELTGMAQTTVHKLITGITSDPRISTLQPITSYFGISLDTLLSESPKFNTTRQDEPRSFFDIPLLTLQELKRLSSDIRSLNKMNWPNWTSADYEESKIKNTNLFGVSIEHSIFPAPFEQNGILIANNKINKYNNSYVILRNINSAAINIRKLYQDGEIIWLLSLQNGIPPQKLNEAWEILGTITEYKIKLINM